MTSKQTMKNNSAKKTTKSDDKKYVKTKKIGIPVRKDGFDNQRFTNMYTLNNDGKKRLNAKMYCPGK